MNISKHISRRTVLVATCIATYALCVAYSKSKEGGSGDGYVSVHPRIFAAKNAYQSCDDAPPNEHTECIEGVALNYNFYDTLDDEMNVVVFLPEGCPPPAIVPDLQNELEGQFIIDEARPGKVIGRILERKIGPLIGFFEERTAEWGDFDFLPGQSIVIPEQHHIATETWMLHRGKHTTSFGNSCEDEFVHHAYFVRDRINMIGGGYDPDDQLSWPPDADLTNTHTTDIANFVISKDSLRDEHFCFANPTNTSEFCDDYLTEVATGNPADYGIPKGLPELWERNLFSFDNNNVQSNFISVDEMNSELSFIGGDSANSLVGFHFHGNHWAVGFRDETEFHFREVDYHTQCIEMEVEIPVYVAGTGEAVTIDFMFYGFDRTGTTGGTADFVFPSFKANVFAEYLLCTEYNTSPAYPTNLQVGYNDSLSMSLVDVSVVTEMQHPFEPTTTWSNESHNWVEWMLDAIESRQTSGSVEDPVPFLSAALIRPMEVILEDWSEQYSYFLTNYIWENNNILATESKTGTEKIAAISGIEPFWDSNTDGCREVFEGDDYAGVSFVIVEANDKYPGINGERLIAEGKNVSSYQKPAQWVRLNGNELQSLDTVMWLQDIDASYIDIEGNPYTNPMARQELEDFMKGFLTGIMDLSLNDYHGGNFCEDKWDDIETELSDGCVNITMAGIMDKENICEYILNEAEVDFFETCVQPNVIQTDLFCFGVDTFGIEADQFRIVNGERNWYKMSDDYKAMNDDLGSGCPITECQFLESGDFEPEQIDNMQLPSPYFLAKSEGDELHVPGWISIEMEINATLKAKVTNSEVCDEYTVPNEGLYDAYSERLDLLDTRIAANFNEFDDAPRNIREEYDWIDNWLDENQRIPVSDAADEMDIIAGYLDDAAYEAVLSEGILELQLAVDWGFPMYKGRSWEWAASDWAGNVVPYQNYYAQTGDLAYTPEHEVEATVGISLDGICLYVDSSDISASGGAYAPSLENTMEAFAQNPCGFGEQLMGDYDFGDLVDFELPLPFVENNYWELLQTTATNQALNRVLTQQTFQAVYNMSTGDSIIELPTIIATSQNKQLESVFPEIYVAFNPPEAAIYPRMMVMDEMNRTVAQEYDDGWGHYEFDMNEMIVARTSYSASQTMTVDDLNTGNDLWVGGDVEYFSDTYINLFLFEPYFGNEIDESLPTIDEYGSAWSSVAGSRIYNARDDRDFFASGMDWNPHENPIDLAECSPDWMPGQK